MTRWQLGLALVLSAGVVSAEPLAERRAIARANRIYLATNESLGQMKRVKKTLEGFSLEGGDLVAWTKGGKVRKIEAHHFGEMWRGTDELFFDNAERLCFIVQTVSRYADTDEAAGLVEVSRFYLDDGRLVASRPDRNRDPDELADQIPRLIARAHELVAGANRTNDTVVAEHE